MTKTMSYDADLELALSIADSCDLLTQERFGAQDLQVTEKPDMTLVSDADRAVELLIRDRLSAARPGDAIYGEEYGSSGEASRQWIIDPIDGTHSFVRGVPVWATLISLVEQGEVAVGVVSAPALNRRWWARLGGGAYLQVGRQPRQRLQVSQVTEMESASLSYSSLVGWRRLGLEREFLDLQDTCWRSRAYGDFWSYMLVAEGAVDIATEPDLELYDMAALVPIVVEAGGSFTSLVGAPGPWGANAVATNGYLHDHVLGSLHPEK